MIQFSIKYLPTSLFSLKESNSTNSGAKSLFLPSPYSIKMAILNQAITIGGDLKKLEGENSVEFKFVSKAKISFKISLHCSFCVTNSFVKILKLSHNTTSLQQTVAFREYVYISEPLEIIFEVDSENAKAYLKQYLHRINYFGKRGCFFQFLEYSDKISEANVKEFKVNSGSFGMLQEYDDFDDKTTFDNVNNFSNSKTKRKKVILSLPLKRESSSKSFSHYVSF